MTNDINQQSVPVIVTTIHRGVYFGLLFGDPASKILRLTDVRHVFSWSAPTSIGVGGIGSLATLGPQPGSRIGPKLPEMVVHDVATVFRVTDEALPAWEAAKWS